MHDLIPDNIIFDDIHATIGNCQPGRRRGVTTDIDHWATAESASGRTAQTSFAMAFPAWSALSASALPPNPRTRGKDGAVAMHIRPSSRSIKEFFRLLAAVQLWTRQTAGGADAQAPPFRAGPAPFTRCRGIEVATCTTATTADVPDETPEGPTSA